MYVIGFFIAGIVIIMVGVHIDKASPDFSKINYDIWIYSWALLAAAFGIFLEDERLFCRDNTNRPLGYFGGLLEFAGVLSMGGLGFGLAEYFSEAKNAGTVAEFIPANRRDLSSMIAVASIVYLIGSVLRALELNEQGKRWYNVDFCLRYFNILMCVLLSIFWFLFANVMVSTTSTATERTRTYSNTIGCTLLCTGLGGFLKCFSAYRD